MIAGFHLTHISNLKSIREYGLLPSYIIFPNHWEYFKKRLNLKERKAIYFWHPEQNYKNYKYIIDMIACHYFIKPRNITDIYYWEKKGIALDFFYDKGKMPDIDSYFVLLKCNIKKNYSCDIHIQESEDRFQTLYRLDDRYTHDDKYLITTGKPVRDISVQSMWSVRIKNNNISANNMYKNIDLN